MRVIDLISAPWAITPEMFTEVQGIYARHMRGDKINIKDIEARVGAPLTNQPKALDVSQDGVAVISIEGVLAKRMNLFSQISGGTSMQMIGNQVRQALADPNVTAIVLSIDSPGGTVDGTQELADLIFASRDKKPIVTYVDGTMASAAYWIGSAAEQVYISTETSSVGSIGVVATHTDFSRYEKNSGIDSIEITAGKFKRLETEGGTLTREGRQILQAQVDQVYGIFVGQVARNRGTTTEDVQNRMADGRMFIGKQAIDAGLVDGVSTLEGAMSQAAALAAMSNRTALDGVSTTVIIEKVNHMNVDQLKKEHPSVAEALVAEGAAAGREKGLTEGKAEGRTEGAVAERERITAVLAQKMSGHEKLVDELAFDGKTSGPEAAVKVLQAERAKGAKQLDNLRTDANKVTVPAAADPESSQEKKAIEPRHTAAKAREYIEAQKKIGNRVTEADAVDHVLNAA